MDFSTAQQFVSNVGFPIAMVFILLYQSNKQEDWYKENVNELKETIAKNTQALEVLNEIMRGIKNGKEND